MDNFWNWLKDLNNHYGVLIGSLATLILAIIAIWGVYFQSKIFKLKLKLILLNNETAYDESRLVAYVYHLQIIKTSKIGMVKNCRLLLTKIQDYKDNKWIDLPWNVARQLENAPSESDTKYATFPHKQTVDFGMIRVERKVFSPSLRDIGFNRTDELIPTDGILNLKRRYYIEIEAENYFSENHYIYEVNWNGQWSDNPEEMNRNFKIEAI